MILINKRAAIEHNQILDLGQRVALKESNLIGTVIDYHNSFYTVFKKNKATQENLFGYRVQWDSAGIGICQSNDLELIKS